MAVEVLDRSQLVGSAAYRRRKPGMNYDSQPNIDTCKAQKCHNHGTVLIDGHCAVCIFKKIKNAPSWWTYPDFFPQSKY